MNSIKILIFSMSILFSSIQAQGKTTHSGKSENFAKGMRSINSSAKSLKQSEKTKRRAYQVDLIDMIKTYSKEYEEAFIVTPGLRGRVATFYNKSTDKQQAFNRLTHALKLNGYTVIKKGPQWIVISARNAQRDQIPVYVDQLPPSSPELMVTYIHHLKNNRADAIFRDLRVITSKDGEMSLDKESNSLIISDYSSNINRVAKILKAIDH